MAEDTKRGVIVNRMGAFVAIPITFINDTRITNAGRCLYMLLSSYTSAKADEAIAFPSYETIMARLDWNSKHTVADALVNLLTTGWVERKRRFSSSSVYTINFAPNASSAESALLAVQKVHYQKCRNRTTDSAESAPYPEVLQQEVPHPEVARRGARKTRAVSGFGSVYTSHDDPRVAAFLEILARKQITATDAEIIQKRVATDTVDVWRDVLQIWAANPNWPLTLANIFDRYERTVNAKRFTSKTDAPSYQNGARKNAKPWSADGAMEILRARAAARGETI
jgi:hypothetical protein